MFPGFCGPLGLLGWLVTLLLWAVAVSLVMCGIAWLFPRRRRMAEPKAPPASDGDTNDSPAGAARR
jgi:cytochrome c-type biogenesis protein CcmH/NrfF